MVCREGRGSGEVESEGCVEERLGEEEDGEKKKEKKRGLSAPFYAVESRESVVNFERMNGHRERRVVHEHVHSATVRDYSSGHCRPTEREERGVSIDEGVHAWYMGVHWSILEYVCGRGG